MRIALALFALVTGCLSLYAAAAWWGIVLGLRHHGAVISTDIVVLTTHFTVWTVIAFATFFVVLFTSRRKPVK